MTTPATLLAAVADDPDADRIDELLRLIETEQEYYPQRADLDSARILRRMAELKLIRWCPYPDEFYVLQPSGTAVLEARSAPPRQNAVDLAALESSPTYQGSVQSMYSVMFGGRPHL